MYGRDNERKNAWKGNLCEGYIEVERVGELLREGVKGKEMNGRVN